MRRDLTHRILLNTASSGVGQTVRLGQALVLTPYLLHNLGADRFAVWSLALVLASYLSLLDLGIGAALTKRVAEHAAVGEMGAVPPVVSTGVAFYSVSVLVLSPLLFLSRYRIVELFHVPADIVLEAQFAFVGLVFVIGFTQISASVQAVLTGLQRMDLTNGIQVGASLLRLIGSFAAVEAGFALRGLVVVEAVVLLLGTGALVLIARRLLSAGALGVRHVRWSEFKELLRYGLKVQATQAVGVAGLHTGRLILGVYVSLGAVVFYDIGNKLVQGVKSLSLVLTSAVVPVASELDVTRGVPGLQRFYLRGMKYLFLVTVPLMGFGLAAAPSLIGAWVGSDYAQAAIAVQLLGVGNAIHVLTAMGTKVSRGMGRPELETQYAMLLLVLTVALSISGALVFGYVGVLVATLIALVVSSMFFFVRFHRLIELPARRLLSEVCTVPTVAGATAGLCVWGISILGRQLWTITGRTAELALLAVEGLVFVVVYALWIGKTRYLSAEDRQLGVRLYRAITGLR